MSCKSRQPVRQSFHQRKKIMARLPIPGADQGSWGNILNDFLLLEHNPDGSLKIRADLANKASANEIVKPYNGGQEGIVIAQAGASYAIQLAAGNIVSLTLTTNCTITFPVASSGVAWAFTLELIQGTGGAKTVQWPAAVRWAGGIAPVLSSAGGAVDVFSFYTIDAGANWRGFLSGNDIK